MPDGNHVYLHLILSCGSRACTVFLLYLIPRHNFFSCNMSVSFSTRQTGQLQVLSAHHQSGGVCIQVFRCIVFAFLMWILMVTINSMPFVGAVSFYHPISCIAARSYQLPISGGWWDKSRQGDTCASCVPMKNISQYISQNWCGSF